MVIRVALETEKLPVSGNSPRTEIIVFWRLWKTRENCQAYSFILEMQDGHKINCNRDFYNALTRIKNVFINQWKELLMVFLFASTNEKAPHRDRKFTTNFRTMSSSRRVLRGLLQTLMQLATLFCVKFGQLSFLAISPPKTQNLENYVFQKHR